MNEETISQEQYLFNQLNFEERKNIIEIMEYIINLQQENNQLAEKVINQRHALCDTNKKIQVLNARIEKAIEYIDKEVRFVNMQEYHNLSKILKGEVK